ncbi:winged helix-turn-helix domain-containing protein [Pseudoruegeria sp. SHC-113]|uniref:winged helix-turn-helix domain-containing protein n=1 Tax=Pseudoruegeria sp. SHC-113 TaxID=2855439 RepID=UPI0021BAA11E|nr:winged helix-turn-helix domain-containing protein [Pseudoruegeria sp. SHC-113]MCT8159896.1 winged helix-turn-helix domain-containing protein [Pseudoruegeria sp. SHC-113]
MATDTITFGDCQLDLSSGELRRSGGVVALEPIAFELIVFLASRPGELVTKDALVEGVWGGRAISDSAISSCVAAARAAIGDSGAMQRYIKTVPRRGFRFVARAEKPRSTPLPVPDLKAKPSIAVLPFTNMSGDPERAYFSDGITGDIITDLSRYNELFVIARHSSFAYRDAEKSSREIASELGVQYLVEGSVQRAAERIRVNVRLIDPSTANEIWAERYNREAADIFEVQDEITAMIVNRLVGQIERRHQRNAASGRETGLSAYDYILRAQQSIFDVGRENNQRALSDVQKALEIDPTNARAHALLGWHYITEATNSWGMDPNEAYQNAWDCALYATSANDDEPFGFVVLAWVYLWRDRLFDRALVELQKACDMNPSNAAYRSYLAFAQIYAGKHEAGKANLEGAMQLNPHFPVLYDVHYMRALFHLHDSKAALAHAVRVRSHMPQASNALSLAAAIFASLGMDDDARQVVDRIKQVSPDFTRAFVRRHLPYRKASDQEYFLEMLEAAGLPE